METDTRPLKERVSLTLDSDIVTSVRSMAERDDRSFSQYINLVLKHHLHSASEDMEHDPSGRPGRAAGAGVYRTGK